MLPRSRTAATAAAAAMMTLSGCGISAPGPDDNDEAGTKVVASGAPGGQEDVAGSRENPLQPGDTFRLDQWEITFHVTNRDARDELVDGDPFMRRVVDEEVPAGSAAVLVPITLAFDGPDSSHPWKLQIDFVDGTGTTVNHRCPGLFEKDYVLAGEMFTGAVADVTTCVIVAGDRIDGGMWIVEEPYNADGSPAQRLFVGLGQ